MKEVLDPEFLPVLLKTVAYPSLDDLYAAIGYGGFTAQKAVSRIQGELQRRQQQRVLLPHQQQSRQQLAKRHRQQDALRLQPLSQCGEHAGLHSPGPLQPRSQLPPEKAPHRRIGAEGKEHRQRYPPIRIWNTADPETFPRGGIHHLFGGGALLYQLPALYIEVIRLLVCLY